MAGEEDAASRRRTAEAAGAVVQRLAETAIKAYLATRPVYRFKEDFKGVVLKAALVDVSIQQNTLAVTFSLWNLTVTVAIFAVALILVLLAVVYLIRHPLWGLGTIASIATHDFAFLGVSCRTRDLHRRQHGRGCPELRRARERERCRGYRLATSSKICANSTAPGFLMLTSMRSLSAASSSAAVFSRTMVLR